MAGTGTHSPVDTLEHSATRAVGGHVDIWTVEPAYRYAKYQTFWVEPASTNYRMFVSGYSGNATDQIDYHNGMAFSTPDRDCIVETVQIKPMEVCMYAHT